MGSLVSDETEGNPQGRPAGLGPKTVLIDTQLQNGFTDSTNPATVAAPPSPAAQFQPPIPAFPRRVGYPQEETKDGYKIRTFRPLPWAT